MCGRENKTGLALLLLLLLLFPLPALARNVDFGTVMPFGIGVAGGVEKNPSNGFLGEPQSWAMKYTQFAQLEPFFDMTNFSLHAVAGYHWYPTVSASGADSQGAFHEWSAGGSFDYGLRALFAPVISANHRSRLYFTAGYLISSTTLKNWRSYNNGKPFAEHVRGKGETLMGGVGVEAFLLQNISVQWDLGYIRRTIDSFKYLDTTSVSGATVSAGATATDDTGQPGRLNVRGPYTEICLALHF